MLPLPNVRQYSLPALLFGVPGRQGIEYETFSPDLVQYQSVGEFIDILTPSM